MRDLTGKTFGRLLVVRRGKSDPRHSYWLCRCECGTEKEIRADGLCSGAVLSCGCLHRDVMSARGYRFAPGKKFGRLRIIECVGRIRKRGRLYRCRCNCGRIVTVQGRHLRSGETQSCGCLYDETRATAGFKHGHSRINRRTLVYSAYHRQRSLCRNPRTKFYEYYGGRGIAFLFDSFPQFYAEVGNKPTPDHRLMRIDSDGHFEAGNLLWVPMKRRRRKRVGKASPDNLQSLVKKV